MLNNTENKYQDAGYQTLQQDSSGDQMQDMGYQNSIEGIDGNNQDMGYRQIDDSGYGYNYRTIMDDTSNIRLDTDEDITARRNNLPQFPGYDTLSKLGSGAFGAVYLGVDQETGDRVALKTIKIVPKMGFPAWGTLKLAEREVESLKDIQPGCIPYLSCFRDSVYFEDIQTYLIVMEYVEGSTIDKYNFRPSKEARDLILILNDLTKALEYVHSKNLIHNDIKPDNIKITEDLIPVLLDFGLSCVTDKICPINDKGIQCCSKALGTYRPFTPPEGVRKEIVGTASDVWELALTIYVIVIGYPFGLYKWDASVSSRDLERVNNNILNLNINNMYNDEEMKSDPDKYFLNYLVMRGLDKDPAKRITINQMRQELDKYFNEYPIGSS